MGTERGDEETERKGVEGTGEKKEESGKWKRMERERQGEQEKGRKEGVKM